MAFIPSFGPQLRSSIRLGALALALGCSNQGEGERCDPLNGSADCASGLVCTAGDRLTGVEGEGAALCCPEPGQAPTTEGCQLGGMELPVDGDGGVPSGGAGGGGAGGGGAAGSGAGGGGAAGSGGAGGTSAAGTGGTSAAGTGGTGATADAGAVDAGS